VITNDHAWRIDPLDNYPHDSVTRWTVSSK